MQEGRIFKREGFLREGRKGRKEKLKKGLDKIAEISYNIFKTSQEVVTCYKVGQK